MHDSARHARPRSAQDEGNRSGALAIVLLVACMAGSLSVVGCSDAADRQDEIKSLVEAGRFSESIELLEDALKVPPRDPELLYLYGVANMGLGRPSLAIWPFLAAKDRPGWAMKAGLALVRAAIASGDPDQAIQSASALLENDPDHVVALQLRAESRILTKAYEEALEDADRLIDLDEEIIAAHVVRLQALLGLERMEDIETDFDKLESMWSDESFPPALAQRYCTARAMFANERGDNEESAKRFEGCLESFPNSRIVLQAAVKFFDETRDSERATAILREAVERDPSAGDLSESLANRLRGMGKIDSATQVLIDATAQPGPGRAKAWAALAYHYFSLEDFEKSVEAWKELLEILATPDEGVLFSYAESLVRAHHFEEAEEVAKRLPESLAALTRAIIHLERGEPETALAHFDAGQRLWPNNAVARYFAGMAAERALDIDRAIIEFRHAIRIDADETPSPLRLARILEAQGELDAARTALNYFLRAHSTDVEANLMSLRIMTELMGPQIVERTFLTYRWPRAEMGSIVGKAAEIVLRKGGSEPTLSFLSSLRGMDFRQPRNADALRVFVRALAESGRVGEAKEWVDAALAAHPNSAALHEIRASQLERMGARADAVRAAREKALELDPEYSRTLVALAESAAAAGREDEARRLFERAAASDPNDFISRRRAADLAARAGATDEAIRLLQSVLDESPQDARAAIRLAQIVHEQRNDLARAAQLARVAVRYRGGSDAFDILNRVHLETGAIQEAVTVLREASERQGDDPSLHYHLGRALRLRGQTEAAVASFERAIAVGADRNFPERKAAESEIAELSRSASVMKKD